MSATRIYVDGIVLIISLFFSSLLVLVASSFYILNADIELQLISHVRERFDDENLQFSVDFSGRDGVIGGNVANEKERQEAITIAKSVEGVRTIKHELSIINMPDNTNDLEVLFTEPSVITNNIDETVTITEITESPGTIEPIDTSEKINDIKEINETKEKAIISEFLMPFKLDTIELSPAHESSLNSATVKLMNDPSLFVEIVTSHSKSTIAIQRANSIKIFFEKQGINKNHFYVIWDDSENKNLVQLKLFQKR